MKPSFALHRLLSIALMLTVVFGFASLAHVQAVEFVLLGTDPDEMPTVPNINKVSAVHDANRVYFQITSHVNWGNDVYFVIDLDVDQKLNTGVPDYGIGADYSVDLYLEGGDLSGGLWVYDATLDDWMPTDSTVYDVFLVPNSNTLEFSLELKDIGNPQALDFQIVMFFFDLIDEVRK